MSISFETRIGASIRRAPYVWLTATILLFFFMNSPLRAVVKDEDHKNVLIAVGASVFIAYAVVNWAVFPRLMARSKVPQPRERLLMIRWVIATSAYLTGFVAVIAGGQQWCYGLGFVVSIVLLVLTARWARKDSTPDR